MTLLSVVKRTLVFCHMQWQKCHLNYLLYSEAHRRQGMGGQVLALTENSNGNKNIISCLFVLSALENLEKKKKKNDGLTVLNFHFSKETKSFSVCSSKVTIVSLVVSQDFWKQIPKSNP